VDFELQWKARELVLISDEAHWSRERTAKAFTRVAGTYAGEGNHAAARLFDRAALEATRGW
jgi:N-acetylglucosamine kinase-like BadF-type ATPase